VDITRERLDLLIEGLVAGRLDHRQVLEEGGHGAYIRKAVGSEALNAIIATGPKRRLVQGSRYPMIFGAPLGDNMMTGCVACSSPCGGEWGWNRSSMCNIIPTFAVAHVRCRASIFVFEVENRDATLLLCPNAYDLISIC